jgi:hypothetical protein
MLRHTTFGLLLIALVGCGGGSSPSSSTVSKQNLNPGDANCPTGGVALTVDGDTSYICNGTPGGAGATVATLPIGNSHCPTGGTSVTASGATTYVCNGVKGDVGLTGGGIYTSRNDVYCDTVSMPNNPAVYRVTATCRTVSDLPLTGWCDLVSSLLPAATKATLILEGQGPTNWQGAGGADKADWSCSWANASNSYVNAVGATASICCVSNPG